MFTVLRICRWQILGRSFVINSHTVELCNTPRTTIINRTHNINSKKMTDSNGVESLEKKSETGDDTFFTVLDPKGWDNRWKEGDSGWNKSTEHPLLVKHFDTMINNRKDINIFLPLCGKSIDIKWLADKGLSVVGAEFSEMAVEEFFQEHSIEYTKEEVSANTNIKLFKSKDGKVKLYCSDYYILTSDIIGTFDAIWDRGSLVAVNRDERQKYTDLLKTFMKPSCRMLLDTYIYNEREWPGPPHYVPDAQIKELLGDDCVIEELDDQDVFKPEHHGKNWGVTSLREKIHLITKKNTS